jgi:hypothetical protein
VQKPGGGEGFYFKRRIAVDPVVIATSRRNQLASANMKIRHVFSDTCLITGGKIGAFSVWDIMVEHIATLMWITSFSFLQKSGSARSSRNMFCDRLIMAMAKEYAMEWIF